MELTIYGQTDVGLIRDHNEDSFWYDKELKSAIVSDGMGGHAAGEIASAIAVHSFEKIISSQIPGAETLDDVEKAILSSIGFANQEVWRTVQKEPSKAGMGATVVGACLWREVCIIGYIGDSRAYLIRSRNIYQITKDHSFVQELVDIGAITEKAALSHPQRNVITRAIGADKDETGDIVTADTIPGDIILLCSDGLTAVLEDREILDIVIQSKSLEIICRSLIEKTLIGGAPDNVTVVLMKTLKKKKWELPF